MDMVRDIESRGTSILIGPERREVGEWADRVISKSAPLTMPRYPLLGLPEFATVAALDHFTARKRKASGDFFQLRENTRACIKGLMPRARGA
jgi:glutaredoxin 2